MSALTARIKSLPFIAKVLIGAAAFLIGYFGIVEPVLGIGTRWSNRASSLENALRRDAELASNDGDGRVIEQGQEVFGTPNMPGVKETTPEAFYRLVNGILESHGVTDRTVSERSVPLTGEQADSLGAGQITRLILEVTFEADSSTVVSIISELEHSSMVAAISRVRIDKTILRSSFPDASGDLVRATIAPEAWTTARGTGGSR